LSTCTWCKSRSSQSSAKKSTSRRRSSSKRELIDTGKNEMFAKRTAKRGFKEMEDAGRSLSSDRRRTAKKATTSGFGDQGTGGDQRRSDRTATPKRVRPGSDSIAGLLREGLRCIPPTSNPSSYRCVVALQGVCTSRHPGPFCCRRLIPFRHLVLLRFRRADRPHSSPWKSRAHQSACGIGPRFQAAAISGVAW
jgi:hypothetical protein